MADTDPYERYTRLLLEHEPEILRAVLVLVPNRADARDIVQETAVTLWQHFEQYDRERSFANWAIGFARIQIRRFLRNGSRRTALTERAAELIHEAQDQRAAFKEKRDAALRDCLEHLPSRSREIIKGYYFQERSVDALSAAQGCSVDAIYKTLQRLRAALLDCINRKVTEA